MEDMKPLMDVRNVHTSEPGLNEALMEASSLAGPCFPAGGGCQPHHVRQHPVSKEEATRVCTDLIDKVRPQTFYRLRRAWWDFLRSAKQPEEKLSAERMIDAVNLAWGMSRVDETIRMRADRENQGRIERIHEAQRAEVAAIDRWR